MDRIDENYTSPLTPLQQEELEAARLALLTSLKPDAGIWVFGYGSLMWDPGFSHEEALPATLHGYHRAFCIYSHRYRGTPERPGLVLGLDRGGSCHGMAYRVAGSHARQTMDYLWQREMVYGVYRPYHAKARLERGNRVGCWTFVAEPSHSQYAGRLSMDDTATLILQGHGLGGPCGEYLANTVRHLDELGIDDGPLHRLLLMVDERRRA